MNIQFRHIISVFPSANNFNVIMLFFRTAISLELIIVHGLKKLGINGAERENIPNPLHVNEAFNDIIAISANLLFPVFVIIGLFTRIAVLPILAVTLTGYFVVHL